MLRKLKILEVLTIVFLLLAVSCTSSKPKAKITKEVTIYSNQLAIPDSTSLGFCRFVDANPAHYFFMLDTVVVMNKSFKKKFELDATGIITLAPNKFLPKTYVICEPGDAIAISLKTLQDGSKSLFFVGNNAEGLNEMQTSLLFKGTNYLTPTIEKGLDKVNSLQAEQSFSNLLTTKDSLFAPFDILLEQEKITKSFYSLAKAQSDMKFLGATRDVILHLRGEDSLQQSVNTLNSILRQIFKTFDPFDDTYKSVDLVSRTSNASYKAQLIEEGLLVGKKIEFGLWKDQLQYNTYAPKELQEKMKAVSIMFNRHYGMNSIEEDERAFSLFKTVFPKSVYTQPLSRYFSEFKDDNELLKPLSLAKYTEESNSFSILDKNDMLQFDVLLAENFKNTAVFIDVWATWCAPCIKEFQFTEELKPFLKDKNIEVLYVSVDNPTAAVKWKTAVQKYKLNGYHLLGTEAFVQNLKELQLANISGIPRYLLFDAKGTLLDAELPLPSSGSALKQRIEELYNIN
ncbi:TlpA family protein disulfide reductase [Aquimarina intermedia]|uniref:Thiol-disulfide isomerase/thioredoxin n=1 Tax=Aquimarina intermedia TaxID=350814 RepID=A0A5S5CG53_9FLAO|nr:TlpA disulfide reductase family protein [Aquimarina intermedia]TYP76993.1 thiol-disulfide isomerase/thioredoxin [Aquimarina intermedia]